MAFSFGFYNSFNHDRRYNSIQISMIFDGIISDGIYATVGEAMVVKATSEDNVVVVGPGRGWFDHTWNYNDADLPVNAPISDVLLKRIDALVLDINANENFRGWKDFEQAYNIYKKSPEAFTRAYGGTVDMSKVTDKVKELYNENGGNPSLDGYYNTANKGHTVFAQVFDGMDTIFKIANAKTDANDKPLEEIKILSSSVSVK